MAMKILAVVLAWTGCVLPYLASKRQQLLVKTLPGHLAWGGFGILQLLAVMALSTVYSTTIAFFLVLMVVMCSWSALILAAGHLRGRPVMICSLGVVVLSVVMVVG